MSAWHEQARAEAEREYPPVPIAFRGLTYPADAMRESRVGAYARGFLAGHEAATRTRVVTTVTELDALRVGSVVLFEDGAVAKQLLRDRWYFVGYNSPLRKGDKMLRAHLPARVLHDPEETR